MSVWLSALFGSTDQEKKKHSMIHKLLFEELQRIFTDKDLKRRSERRYDIAEVKALITQDLQAINQYLVFDGEYMACYEGDEPELHAAVTQWLDDIVRNKTFVDDNPHLKQVIRKKILEYAVYDKFRFDWHYWQLFREQLPVLHNSEQLEAEERRQQQQEKDALDALREEQEYRAQCPLRHLKIE